MQTTESLRRELETQRNLQQRQQTRMSSVVDTKLMAKPQQFSGEHEKWGEWSFTLRAYTFALDQRLPELMQKAVASAAPVPLPTDEFDRQLSVQLYYILAMLVKDRALTKLRAAPEGNGLEVWRQFGEEWEPRHSQRFSAMLAQILSHDFQEPLVHNIEQWEREIKMYEDQSGDTISDTVKNALLITKMKEESIRQHL
eukprot:5779812-Amphidinium_carterae.1